MEPADNWYPPAPPSPPVSLVGLAAGAAAAAADGPSDVEATTLRFFVGLFIITRKGRRRSAPSQPTSTLLGDGIKCGGTDRASQSAAVSAGDDNEGM